MRLVPKPEHLVLAFVNEWRTFGTDKTFDIPPGGTFEQSVGFAIERNRYDTVNVPWRLCWSHPTKLVYDPGLRRLADGSYSASTAWANDAAIRFRSN